MITTPYKDLYTSQLDSLYAVVAESNDRVMREAPDELILTNVNFFTKSFLVMMCVYLESYIKEALVYYGTILNGRLSSCRIPHNLLKWSLQPQSLLKDSDRKECIAEITITKDNIDKHISANPYRTKDLFVCLGVNLQQCSAFLEMQEEINAIITKRNQVIHYNDDASDVSDGDLKLYIQRIKKYIVILDAEICRQI